MRQIFFYTLTIVLLAASISCSHDFSKISIEQKDQNELYEVVKNQLKKTKAFELKECNCMKAFYRDLHQKPDNTSRYVYDKLVGEHAVLKAKGKNTVDVLVIGSGTLLNELTAVANILARRKNLNLYITDWAYVFYQSLEYKKKALSLGKNPDLIPLGWKDFYFWKWYKNQEKPYIPFFEKHHRAIDKFKRILANLDKHFGTKSSVSVLKPAANKAIKLPNLDLILSIDAFIDLPNLMWNLFYRMDLNQKSVRFLCLNKNKPLGYFWDSPDLSIREENSLEDVNIGIYDITHRKTSGSYKVLDSIVFKCNKEQKKLAPEFKDNPEREATQNFFDMKI